MTYNCDNGFQYYYPFTYQYCPTNQLPKTYATQCDPQSCNNSNFLAYQNQLRNLQNREVTMEYWTRQLEYFRNLLKNFAAEIESPEHLKKLLATCCCDVSKKRCFDKRRKFYNIDKDKKVTLGKCNCKNCLEKLLLQLCNALSIPEPSWNNKCNCPVCRRQCQNYCCAKNPQNSPDYYYYIPYQISCPTAASAYCYYYPQQQQQQQQQKQQKKQKQQQQQQQQQYFCQMPPPSYPCYFQQMPQQCNNNCNNCNNCCEPNCGACNKCKFKYILNQLNYILLSAEQQKSEAPCECACASKLLRKKSCCSIKEINEEAIKTVKKSDKCTKNSPKDRDSSKQEFTDSSYCEFEITLSGLEKCNDNIEDKRVEKGTKCMSEISKCHKIYSDTETINDASNISNEVQNCETSVKKHASIVLGEKFISPSGTFEVLLEDLANKSSKKSNTNNSSCVFEVGYATYTKPKCDDENKM